MKLKGKVSWWFYGIILCVAAVTVPLIVVSAFADPDAVALTVNLAVFAAVESFCISIAVCNYVKFQKEALLIRFGFIKKEVPYRDIAALLKTHNPLSSLAASLDRIEIKCRNNDSVMISVMDPESFFHEIQKYNSDIVIM